jgi:hypothetical protein
MPPSIREPLRCEREAMTAPRTLLTLMRWEFFGWITRDTGKAHEWLVLTCGLRQKAGTG